MGGVRVHSMSHTIRSELRAFLFFQIKFFFVEAPLATMLLSSQGDFMTIVGLLLSLAIAGFIVWIILQIPMPQIFRNIIYGVVGLFLVIYVLQVLGFHTGFPALSFTK